MDDKNLFVKCDHTADFDDNTDNESRWYVIRVKDRNKKKPAQSVPLKHGDVFRLQNENWPNAALYLKDDSEIGCNDEGLKVEWKVCKWDMINDC